MAVSHPGKLGPCFLSAAQITQTKAHSVRGSSLRNAPLALSVQEQGPTNAELDALWFLLSAVILFDKSWHPGTDNTSDCSVPSDSFSNYLNSMSHLPLSASVLSCCCCCVVLPLLLSEKPTHLCLLCCRCQLTQASLSLSFCRWKMH